MQQKRNYQKELDSIISDLSSIKEIPSLLLHACCAPCSSYTLEYLTGHFNITLLFYNPNIAPSAEYEKRKAELKRLVAEMPFKNKPGILDCDYNPSDFTNISTGLENLPEGGERCKACYRLRLEAAAKAAKKLNADYFASTLSISPMKDAQKLNSIGEELAKQYDIKHLPNDFKKREGYKRSIELSREYGLYRQNYCGCIFSKAQRERGEKDDRA